MSKIEQPLRMFTVYRNPADYPGKYVLRGASIVPNAVINDPEPTAVADTLAEVRAAVPWGLVPMHRAIDDLPIIVETWI
jgi:hypothetical protein